jgi:hypothetical protein
MAMQQLRAHQVYRLQRRRRPTPLANLLRKLLRGLRFSR